VPQCAKCEVEKPETEFRSRPDRNNWRLPNCRPCERVIQLANYYGIKGRDPFTWKLRIIRANISKEVTRDWIISTLAAQDYRCAISGRQITELDFEVDHITPRSKGGGGELANLRLVCRAANAAKGELTDSELLTLCQEIIGRAIMNADGNPTKEKK
jgi:hypothetical protein